MQLRTIVLTGAMALMITSLADSASAEEDVFYGNQIFFRGAYSALTSSRGNEVFTDTLGTTAVNGDKGGWSIAAGLDLSAMRQEDMGGANVMGEILLEYSKFSDRVVTQTTSALLGAPVQSQVAVTELNVTVAPKLRFDGLGSGRFRPFVVPIGVAFLVNSPPSNDSTYLDVGLHFGGGIDVLVVDRLSVGYDIRYTHGFTTSDTSTRYWSTGGYVALNF